NTGLVTGGTVHSALEEKADKSLGNITGEGKTVISNIAKDSVKVIDGTNTTVTVGADGDAKTYAVNVSNDSIKAAVKDDLDKKANKTADNLTDGDVNSWKDKLGVNDLTGQINGMDNRINHLDTRIDRVGAGAAALAALHPQDYDPEAKWDFAAGYGRYRDANALAIGAFYRPNDGTMFSIGGSMGGGEDMINVGLSLKVGHRNQYAGYSKASLTSVIAEQKATIGKLENQVASQQKQIEEILQQLAALKK
ncbi:MAG: YadA-like family protein, partial [Dialister sp.]|nr:YadA-like family protein [Dialister sp.]